MSRSNNGTALVVPGLGVASADLIPLFGLDLPDDVGFQGQTCDVFWNSTNIFACFFNFIDENYGEIDDPRAINKSLWTDAFCEWTGRDMMDTMMVRRNCWVKAWGLEVKAGKLPILYGPTAPEVLNVMLRNDAGPILNPKLKKIPGFNILNAIDFTWDQFNTEERKIIEQVGQTYLAVLVSNFPSAAHNRKMINFINNATIRRGLPHPTTDFEKEFFCGATCQMMIAICAIGFSFGMYGVNVLAPAAAGLVPNIGGALLGTLNIGQTLWYTYNVLNLIQEVRQVDEENRQRFGLSAYLPSKSGSTVSTILSNATVSASTTNLGNGTVSVVLSDTPHRTQNPPPNVPPNNVTGPDAISLYEEYQCTWDHRQPWWGWEIAQAAFLRTKTQAFEGISTSLGYTTDLLGKSLTALEDNSAPPDVGTSSSSNVIKEKLVNIMDGGTTAIVNKVKSEGLKAAEEFIARNLKMTPKEAISNVKFYFLAILGLLVTLVLGQFGILGPLLSTILPVLKDLLYIIVHFCFKVVQFPVNIALKAAFGKRNS